jgi:hypothetical protein
MLRTALKYMVDEMMEDLAKMLKDDGIDCRTVHEWRRENRPRVNRNGQKHCDIRLCQARV